MWLDDLAHTFLEVSQFAQESHGATTDEGEGTDAQEIGGRDKSDGNWNG